MIIPPAPQSQRTPDRIIARRGLAENWVLVAYVSERSGTVEYVLERSGQPEIKLVHREDAELIVAMVTGPAMP